MLTTKTISEFLDELASSSPAPGGGSAAALSGALGAALVSMVCRLTIGKKKYANVQAEMESTLKRSEELRATFTELVEKDMEAFNAVMRAFAMSKETEEQKLRRTATIQEATKSATLIPLNVMQLCAEALWLTKAVAEKGNINSISDAGVAALMLQAACSGAAFNVRINLPSLQDKPFIEETTEKLNKIQSNVEKLSSEILKLTDQKL
jgi:formiminotetrahydrofolate cyclodeaminase